MPGEMVETEQKETFDIPGTDIKVTVIIDRKDTDKIIDYKTTSVDYKVEDCKNIQSLLYVYKFWLSE